MLSRKPSQPPRARRPDRLRPLTRPRPLTGSRACGARRAQGVRQSGMHERPGESGRGVRLRLRRAAARGHRDRPSRRLAARRVAGARTRRSRQYGRRSRRADGGARLRRRDAAQAAADLLGDPHPLVASAAAVWTDPAVRLPDSFLRWRDAPARRRDHRRPAGPGRAGRLGARAHVRSHRQVPDLRPTTCIWCWRPHWRQRSPGRSRSTWRQPRASAPASPWTDQLERVLRTPARPPGGHVQFVTSTPQAGDVIVHFAAAAGGLEVVSVAAMPDVRASVVLAAAYEIGCAHAAGLPVERRDLATPAARRESAVAASARSRRPPTRARRCCLPGRRAPGTTSARPVSGSRPPRTRLSDNDDPWQAGQVAMARYSRTGFEAAAISGVRCRDGGPPA